MVTHHQSPFHFMNGAFFPAMSLNRILVNELFEKGSKCEFLLFRLFVFWLLSHIHSAVRNSNLSKGFMQRKLSKKDRNSSYIANC